MGEIETGIGGRWEKGLTVAIAWITGGEVREDAGIRTADVEDWKAEVLKRDGGPLPTNFPPFVRRGGGGGGCDGGGCNNGVAVPSASSSKNISVASAIITISWRPRWVRQPYFCTHFIFRKSNLRWSIILTRGLEARRTVSPWCFFPPSLVPWKNNCEIKKALNEFINSGHSSPKRNFDKQKKKAQTK